MNKMDSYKRITVSLKFDKSSPEDMMIYRLLSNLKPGLLAATLRPAVNRAARDLAKSIASVAESDHESQDSSSSTDSLS